MLVDGACHLLLAVVHRHDGQRVERGLLGLAPQDVAVLQLPVAIGDDDVVVFETLALVDRENADAVLFAVLDGLTAERLLPLGHKGVDVSAVFLRKLVQLVVEGTDIRTLFVEQVELEYSIDALGQFIQRQPQQLVSVLDVCLGQQLVERLVLDEQLVLGHVATQYGPLVELGHSGLGQHVGRVRQQVQGLDDEAYRYRCVQTERLVAHQLDVGPVCAYVLCYQRYTLVDAHQYGDALLANTLADEPVDGFNHPRQYLLLIVLLGQQGNADISVPPALLWHFLPHVGVGGAQLLGSRGVILTDALVLHLCGRREEGIVEVDDVALRAVVRVQRTHVQLLVGPGELAVDSVEQAPVARTPAVYALLHIAHDEVLGVHMAHALLQQYLEVLPLHGGGVLELVYHHVLQLRAYLLKDKRRVAVFD